MIPDEEVKNDKLCNVSGYHDKGIHSYNYISMKDSNNFSDASGNLCFNQHFDYIQSVDLSKHKQRLIGFKTNFTDYLLSFEIYTEPIVHYA